MGDVDQEAEIGGSSGWGGRGVWQASRLDIMTKSQDVEDVGKEVKPIGF